MYMQSVLFRNDIDMDPNNANVGLLIKIQVVCTLKMEMLFTENPNLVEST